MQKMAKKALFDWKSLIFARKLLDKSLIWDIGNKKFSEYLARQTDPNILPLSNPISSEGFR